MVRNPSQGRTSSIGDEPQSELGDLRSGQDEPPNPRTFLDAARISLGRCDVPARKSEDRRRREDCCAKRNLPAIRADLISRASRLRRGWSWFVEASGTTETPVQIEGLVHQAPRDVFADHPGVLEVADLRQLLVMEIALGHEGSEGPGKVGKNAR